uniref:Secreted protein n=1 Tax=Cacopsylla melanoneura TaxID=428564 RepID=A0A8D8SIN7_9HEMI
MVLFASFFVLGTSCPAVVHATPGSFSLYLHHSRPQSGYPNPCLVLDRLCLKRTNWPPNYSFRFLFVLLDLDPGIEPILIYFFRFYVRKMAIYSNAIFYTRSNQQLDQ